MSIYQRSWTIKDKGKEIINGWGFSKLMLALRWRVLISALPESDLISGDQIPTQCSRFHCADAGRPAFWNLEIRNAVFFGLSD